MSNIKSRPYKKTAPMWTWQLLLGAGALMLWESLTTLGILDKFFFSRPVDIARRVGEWISTGSVWPHLATTLSEATLAFVMGVASGLVFGFLLARSQFLSDLLHPYIRVFNALPRVVLAPIFLLW